MTLTTAHEVPYLDMSDPHFAMASEAVRDARDTNWYARTNYGLAVLSYRDEDDALRIANDSPYGLGGYVFGGDRTRGRRVVNGLRAGRVSFNGAATDSHTPMGGYKQSGIGRSMGRFGLEEYLEVMALIGME